MGLDVGTKTIGLALSDTRRIIATPLETIRRVSDKARPIVLVPTSRPISRAPAGTASRSSKGLLRITTDDSSF